MIKAIIFDVDGVIIESFEANLKFFQDLMIKAGYKPPAKEEYQKILHAPMWDVIKIFTKSSSEEEIERIWELGRSNKVLYPYDLLIMSPDVVKTIKELGSQYLLGIVTNRVREGIDRVPMLQELKKHFRAVITYQDTERHKPDPQPILFACEKLSIEANEAVYIGDGESDMLAGKAAGTKTILFSDGNSTIADQQTNSFRKLPLIIKTLE